jgi:large subunit ribosomal protein L10
MERSAKAAVITDLKERLARAQVVLVANYQGLTVDEVDGIRREFRRAGCEYKVVKNKLIEKAVAGTAMESIKPLLKGNTALALGYEEPAAPAKVLVKAAKDVPKLKIKGGFADGRVLDAAGVGVVATLPGRDEVRARMLSLMLTPARNFLSLLGAAQQQFVALLSARETSVKEKDNG